MTGRADRMRVDRADRKQLIVQIAPVMRDHDEAIDFYTRQLRFTLAEDAAGPSRISAGPLFLRQASTGLPYFWQDIAAQYGMFTGARGTYISRQSRCMCAVLSCLALFL